MLAALVAAGAAGNVSGQSALERTPNLDGPWAGASGTVYFHFIHRFQVTDGPTRKVLNSPTFLLGVGVPGDVLLATRYASNSVLVRGEPNEWELFGRWSPVRAEEGGPLDLAVQAGGNLTAESLDAELSLARELGRLRLLAAGRAFSSFAGGDGAVALAGGARLRLTRHVGLAGDIARLLEEDREVAWSAGVQLEIPYTPHSISLHVSNALTTTLQGASVGVADERRWGFEFTVPFTVSRYLGGREPERAPDAATAGEAAAVVTMDDRLRFVPDTVRVRAGETVRWRNTSAVVHTVTGDPDEAALASSVRLPAGAAPFDSGDIVPGAEFSHTFTTPGTYMYFCVPHERAGMVGTVVVEPGG